MKSSHSVPYWNWYGFPRIYTFGYMVTQIVGFLLVGIIVGLVLGKRSATAPA